MLPQFHLSEENIRARATAASWQRGVNYFESGAVFDAVWREGTFTAQVEGSAPEPYRVSVRLDEQGNIQEAFCSCPYEGSGDCKHIVAALLFFLHRPEEVRARPSLRTLLEGQSRDQLLALLHFLVEQHPELIDAIEDFVTSSAAEEKLPVAVDVNRLQAQIRAKIVETGRSAYNAYARADDYWTPVSEALDPAIEQAGALLDQGEPRTALLLLEAATLAWIEGCRRLDQNFLEDSEDVEEENLSAFAEIWSEALLSADLSPEERRDWEQKLTSWKQTMIGGSVLEMPLTALRQGWDYPPLVAAMQGNFDERGAWEGEAPDFADDLAQVRLRILKARGRYEEAIHLAEAEGQIFTYLQLLIEAGRSEQAVQEAREILQDPRKVLELCKMLLERGETRLGFELAAHGLNVGETYQRAALAEWLRDQAQGQGQSDLARQAAWRALEFHPAVENYTWLKSHLAAEWETARPQAMKILAERSSYAQDEVIEIYLLEKMYPEAMALVEKRPWSSKLEKVIQAVRAEFPDWAFHQCYQQAAQIMDSAQSSYYDAAVDWLREGRDILLQAGQAARWQSILDDLIEKHWRKFKLRPMLEELQL
jgi:uncharacterized Zn finger protein